MCNLKYCNLTTKKRKRKGWNMEKTKVMIAGLPGKMATLVAEYVEKAEDMELLPFALSEELGEVSIANKEISLKQVCWHCKIINEIYPDIIVDFTLPRSVNTNAELYCQCKIPFVMGTTGGDRELLTKIVENSNISAVIAPNMAKQIVAFQAIMEYAAKNFPGVFKGYFLEISESHQASKADTSGTAKAMVEYFNKLGIPFSESQIFKIRDPEIQQKTLKVPEKYLDGHAWHTYTLQSADETVFFRFAHNVDGRAVYAEGTLDAIRFLNEHKTEKGKVFSMIDVLKG